MKYILGIAWAVFCAYLVWIGYKMIVNPQYRNYITNIWYKSENEKSEEQHRASVKFISGPLYIIAGVSLLVLGIWILSIYE